MYRIMFQISLKFITKDRMTQTPQLGWCNETVMTLLNKCTSPAFNVDSFRREN